MDEEYLNDYSYSSPNYNVPRIKSRKMNPRKLNHIKAVENLLKRERFANKPDETGRTNKNNSGDNTTTQPLNEKKTTSNVVMTVTTTHLWCILFIMIVVLTIMNVITLRNIKEIVKNIQSMDK